MAAAYAALASLMHIIHKIEHHHAPPISLDKQQAQSLTQYITFLQGFLESYNPPVSDEEESADPLEMRIADAAYAAEDVIESHIVDTIKLHHIESISSIKLPFFNQNLPVIKKEHLFNIVYYTIHPHITSHIVDTINQLSFFNCHHSPKELDERVNFYQILQQVITKSFYFSSTESSTTMVGFKDDSLQIMEMLTEDRPDLQVIPIVGIGGIGKTTLARNVFEQKLTKERFYICAWATISQHYNTGEILCDVFAQATNTNKIQLSGMDEFELGSELHKCLFGRRFLIVMDDMWSIHVWNEMRHFFPNNKNGSRILVTTRLYDLSFQLNNQYVLIMPFLDEASSWDLFYKIVFGEKNTCSHELKNITKNIVDCCKGLPLSIIVVGELLKNMDGTEWCWEHHHSPPISLDKQHVKSLTQNITFLQEFFESYNPPVFDYELAVDPDVIESHIVDIIQLRSSRPNQTKTTMSVDFYKNLQQVIEEMGLLSKTAMIIDTAEKVVVPASSASSGRRSFTGPKSTTTVVVGFEDASLQIMEKLTEDQPDLQVIPIVGMGGIGKTTLARNVYERKLIKDRFDICAWATISQQYNTREILCEVYSQITKNYEKKLCEVELGSELHKCLFRRRFLIVMDDMWSIDAWTEIRDFFPNNKNGSRILVTTRLLELSSQLNNDYSHQVGFLDKSNSWDMFSEIVFGEKNICPRELKKIGKKIVDSCRGLPLSIVVMGGLLKKMDATQQCWESIGGNLSSVVNLENDKQCLRLLRLSYNHLPVHLKPCFLYMGVFEEDAEIMVSTLVKLWISEGFLKSMNEESLETSAMRFLKDLVDRNLILISKLGSTGNIKTCKIHDLLRDLCLKEGQKDGFYHVIGQRSPRSIISQRRVIIPSNASEMEVTSDMRSMTCARSVICQTGYVPQCGNLQLFRTFHAYEIDYSLALQCVNLRHFTIKGGNISRFLSPASLLWNLHTIIVFCSDNPIDPIPEIWKMPQLNHIEFVGDTLCLPHPPHVDDAIIMESLQVLKGVRNFKCCTEVVKRIPNIKRLKIRFTGIMGNNVDEYCLISNIKFLSKLESLSINCIPEYDMCLFNLHNLTFPHFLKRLSFNENFELEESMLEKMSLLPYLEKLSLRWGVFETCRWEIVQGHFPCLKYLELESCSGLVHWTAAEEGSSIFPCLEHVSVSYLKELNTIPPEIGNIETLRNIRITGCNEAVVKSVKEMVAEQVELQGDQLPFCICYG